MLVLILVFSWLVVCVTFLALARAAALGDRAVEASHARRRLSLVRSEPRALEPAPALRRSVALARARHEDGQEIRVRDVRASEPAV